MKYFDEFNFNKEDIATLLTYFRNIYQPNNYSGGPDGADFVTNFGSFPIEHTDEEVDRVAAVARKLGFETYKTENGGDGGYDYAVISSRSTIEDFVEDLSWELDNISVDDFTLVG